MPADKDVSERWLVLDHNMARNPLWINLLLWSEFCALQSLILAFLRSLVGVTIGSSHHKYLLHILCMASMCLTKPLCRSAGISLFLISRTLYNCLAEKLCNFDKHPH